MNFSEVRMCLTLLGWVQKQKDNKHGDIRTAEMWANENQYVYLQPGFEGDDVGSYVNYYPYTGNAVRNKYTDIRDFMARLEKDDVHRGT